MYAFLFSSQHSSDRQKVRAEIKSTMDIFIQAALTRREQKNNKKKIEKKRFAGPESSILELEGNVSFPSSTSQQDKEAAITLLELWQQGDMPLIVQK